MTASPLPALALLFALPTCLAEPSTSKPWDQVPEPLPLLGKTLAAGQEHSCVLRRGERWCWGSRDRHRASYRWRPSRALRSEDVAEISSGRFHGCSRYADGYVGCWGEIDSPLGVNSAVQLSSGGDRSCAVTRSGHVRCWGPRFANEPRADPFAERRPRRMARVSDAVAVAVGHEHACALREGGRLRCWGKNDVGQLGTGELGAPSAGAVVGLEGAVAIAAGGAHSCALRRDGAVRCWGRNNAGQLGDGSSDDAARPRRVVGLLRASALAAGEAHTCAIAGGRLSCWGRNDAGQLGDGSRVSRSRPVPARLEHYVSAVAAGVRHSCATSTDGSVHCFGLNTHYQVAAHAPKALRPVAGVENVVELSVAGSHTCALRRDGKVLCWGAKLPRGPLAYVDFDDRARVVVEGVRRDPMRPDLAGGRDFHCAILVTGKVLCWGTALPRPRRIISGVTPHPMGPPDPVETAPRLISGLDDAVAIASSSAHVCVIHGAERAISCWGSNYRGELGDGTFVDRSAPVRVAGAKGARELLLGRGTSCARFDDGKLRCWGYPVLPSKDAKAFSGPPRLPRGGGLSSLVSHRGLRFALARDDGGYGCLLGARRSPICWGGGAYSETTLKKPTPIAALSGARAVALTLFGSCALLQDGAVGCWSADQKSRKGRPANISLEILRGLGEIDQLRLGSTHGCARRVDGRVVCWGDNYVGQRGLGFGPYVPTPKRSLAPPSGPIHLLRP